MEELETHVEEDIKDVDREEEFEKREDEGFDESRDRSEENVEKTPEKVVVEPPAKTAKQQKKKKHGSGGSISEVTGSEGSNTGKAGMTANKSLVQILIELDDHFLKASESTHEVSRMLEAHRMHYHSNFANNQGIQLGFPVSFVVFYHRKFVMLQVKSVASSF